MKLFTTVAELQQQLKQERGTGKRIGFVPTMGALHEGHLSLVNKATSQCDVVVVSIFVNPTQFNDLQDLERYPRVLDKDQALLETTACSYLFAPSVKEVYPEEDKRVFDFGQLDKVLEGKFRPGHFNGVAQVVSRLFSIVEPDKAFFGQKDFQQMVILKQMVRQLGLKIEIVPCPIVRQSDGLALSSRNSLLSPEYRKSAVLISKTLFEAQKRITTMSVEQLKAWVVETINADPLLEVEYFEIVDDVNLMPVLSWSENVSKVGCIAVYAGKIRLIDNISF
ncbi:MAG: pantoate--beta-alanine ligase [Bacteroidota bacterium]|nr:pantoate--beta-alanine ligase [Bacteroidota bacterium]MDP4206568.1 pantoate--beta-alanine ligase [Bacteroidota bacterium]